MVKTIIVNLVSNAIKYSHRDNQVNILIKNYNYDNRYLIVSVQDYGIGIKKSDLEGIFDVKKNSSIDGTDKEPGIGLGLILCKEFITKHNCEI